MTNTQQQKTISHVSPARVFNLPLFECFMLLDTRSNADFTAGHIVTAHSFPLQGCDDSKKESVLLSSFAAIVEESSLPEHFSPIVIYGGEEECVWLANKLSQLRVAHKGALMEAAAKFFPEEQTVLNLNDKEEDGGGVEAWRTYTLDRLIDGLLCRCKEIWILQGGYTEFQTRFSLLCGHDSVSQMKPTPRLVTDQIFLGSRAFDPNDNESLKGFGITHVVTSQKPGGNFLDQVPEQKEGIVYLRCPVEDNSTQHMEECWDATSSFIGQAVRSGGTVLVSLFGRSRSASIIAAFLMDWHSFSPDKAIKILLSASPSIDKACLFVDQLYQRAKRTCPPSFLPEIEGPSPLLLIGSP